MRNADARITVEDDARRGGVHMIDFYIGDVMAQSATLTSVLPIIALWLLWVMMWVFLILTSICAVGAIIYPFYLIFDGIRRKLL